MSHFYSPIFNQPLTGLGTSKYTATKSSARKPLLGKHSALPLMSVNLNSADMSPSLIFQACSPSMKSKVQVLSPQPKPPLGRRSAGRRGLKMVFLYIPMEDMRLFQREIMPPPS